MSRRTNRNRSQRPQAESVDKALSRSEATQEVGVSGANISMGMVWDEFLPELRGQRGIRKLREMRENDAIIGAVMHAMEMLLRGVEWRVEAADDTPQADAERQFVESLLDDMSHTWDDFISEVLSFLVYGWAAFETVFKVRGGPDQNNPMRRSKFDDGRIGIRKIAPRAQTTLDRWVFDEDGGVQAMVQAPPSQAGTITIPIDKLLLFRTTTANNSPVGRSVLRSAYRSWWYATNVENIEAIAIERELNGLPVAYIPSDVLTATTGANSQVRAKYERILRDVKFNEQGFMMLPSDMWPDKDGNPSSQPLVKFDLVASQGTRNIETSPVITRYRQDMARTVLADFVMLGASDKGSFALSKDKSDLFGKSLQGYLSNIAAVINRHLLPRVWRLNGLDRNLMPQIVPGEVMPPNLSELGDYVSKVAGAGFPLFPDDDIERALLDAADLPSDQRMDPDMLGRAAATEDAPEE